MKKNSGSSIMGIVLFILAVSLCCLFIAAVLEASVSAEKRDLGRKAVILNLFNDQEVKLEGWMYNFPVKWIAEEWCLNHSIPEDQRRAKAKELVDRYFYTLSSNTICLKPLPTETKAETE